MFIFNYKFFYKIFRNCPISKNATSRGLLPQLSAGCYNSYCVVYCVASWVFCLQDVKKVSKGSLSTLSGIRLLIILFAIAPPYLNQALASLWAVLLTWLSSPRLPLKMAHMLPEGRSLRSPATGLLCRQLQED